MKPMKLQNLSELLARAESRLRLAVGDAELWSELKRLAKERVMADKDAANPANALAFGDHARHLALNVLRSGDSADVSHDDAVALAVGMVTAGVAMEEERRLLAEFHHTLALLRHENISLRSQASGAQEALRAIEADSKAKTAALRDMRALEPVEVERRIADACNDAREKECARLAAEIGELRSRIGNLESKNEDLRRAKKRLREALDRARDDAQPRSGGARR